MGLRVHVVESWTWPPGAFQNHVVEAAFATKALAEEYCDAAPEGRIRIVKTLPLYLEDLAEAKALCQCWRDLVPPGSATAGDKYDKYADGA